MFFYDAGHSTEETLGAMRSVRRYLAPNALIVIDDSDWERVRAAIDAFLAEEPRARLAERIGGRDEGQPQWWAGMDLIAWKVRFVPRAGAVQGAGSAHRRPRGGAAQAEVAWASRRRGRGHRPRPACPRRRPERCQLVAPTV